MKKLIIFDMDGTLVNSGYAIVETINYVREHLKLDKLPKDLILERVNDPNVNSAEFFYGVKEFSSIHINLFEEHYEKTCLKNLYVYEGIKELLEDLSKKDFILTVATNAYSDFAKKMLEHLDIKKYFPTILGFDNVTKSKPSPQMFEKIIQKHNIKKEDVLVVGDSKKDIMAAENAKVDSVLVNWGFSNHSKEKAIDTVKELEEIIYA
ncbi:MAG: HAD family hydrolase [Arcobacter sp.]|nr:MAG: HAD family hydrolase [Arcobacter sp.]